MEGENYSAARFNPITKAQVLKLITYTLKSFDKGKGLENLGPLVEKLLPFFEQKLGHAKSALRKAKACNHGCECSSDHQNLRDSFFGDVGNAFGTIGKTVVKVLPDVVDTAGKLAPLAPLLLSRTSPDDTYFAEHHPELFNKHVSTVMNHMFFTDAEAFLLVEKEAKMELKEDERTMFMNSLMILHNASINHHPIEESGAALGPGQKNMTRSHAIVHNSSAIISGRVGYGCIRREQDHFLKMTQMNVGNFDGHFTIDLWSDKSNIVWGIDHTTFHSDENADAVMKGMQFAADAWNRVMNGRVTFQYVDDVDRANIRVLHGRSEDSGLLATSTTPTDYVNGNNAIIVYDRLLMSDFRVQAANVLAHEIGHLLGFRHHFALTEEKDFKAGVIGGHRKHSVMSYDYPQYIYLSDICDARYAYDKLKDGKSVYLPSIGGKSVEFKVNRVSLEDMSY